MHFRIHFNPPLEDQARRLAVNAERAYAGLARELVEPRAPIDIVLADNYDVSNGQATPFPTNRIIVWAYPPADAMSLRFYGDWNQLVIQHELTHIFQLDRTRGWWSTAQIFFGRNPFLMPNLYTPAWLTEGLAVYYESRLTGFGRIAGTAHQVQAEAAARDSALPQLDQLSLSAPQWPNGEGPYVYGSLLFSYLAASRGAASVPRYIEESSGAPIPFTLNLNSRQAFGISFEAAWRHWTDSVQKVARAHADPHALALQTLTHVGFDAYSPRWVDSTSLVYAANTQRDMPGVYHVTISGSDRRIARRNGTSPNVPIVGGLVYSQLDYTTPYVIRSDLYRSQDGRTTQLTHDARLSDPDARSDGEMVAVWGHLATTQLVRVSVDGRRVWPITPFTPDTQWSEPRWAPTGRRLTAVRWERGGYMSVVVLDTMGTVLRSVLRERSVVSSPVWTPDGTHLIFTSDRSGRPDIYQVAVSDTVEAAGTGAHTTPAVVLLGSAGAGATYPAVSPDGSWLALSALRGDGYHIAVTPFAPARNFPLGVRLGAADTIIVPPIERDTVRATPYSAWPGLVPRYWTPVGDRSDQGFIQLGVYTSAYDVLDRHAYELEALYNFRQPNEPELYGAYEYRGLGVPVIDVGATAYWTHERVADISGATVGTLVHWSAVTSLAATIPWPTARTNAAWTIGGSWEFRDYHTDPPPLIGNLSSFYSSHPNFPAVFTTLNWTNVQYPALAISPEDGVALAGVGSVAWEPGTTSPTQRSIVGVADAYQALNWPGFAHHVIAVQVAGGLTNPDAISTFTAGGVNSSTLPVVGGLSVGDQPHTFTVRGYPVGAARGTQAISGSLEYRAPLWAPGRGWHLLPLYLGKTSISLFTDAAEVWCPVRGGTATSVCNAPDAERRLLNSVGAELNFDASLQYDVLYRLRLGIAFPTANRDFYGAPPAAVYVALGLSY